MDEETLNMSVRKFLKMVGVNSQRAIEQAIHEGLEKGAIKGDEILPASMTLEIGSLQLKVEYEGDIRLE